MVLRIEDTLKQQNFILRAMKRFDVINVYNFLQCGK